MVVLISDKTVTCRRASSAPAFFHMACSAISTAVSTPVRVLFALFSALPWLSLLIW